MSRKKKPPPRSRIRKAKRPKRKIYTLSGKQILHSFEVEGIEALAAAYVKKTEARKATELVTASVFWRWIRTQTQPKLEDFQIIWTGPSYRVVYGHPAPLTVAGSLAKGGRFNIGGAQLTDFDDLGLLQMQACLYTASTAACALAEAGTPNGNPKIAKITPKMPLVLWDLGKIVANLKWPDIERHVSETAMGANWGLQKVPLVPQILATYLRGIGGAGLIYPSTKKSDDHVLAFYAASDEHMQSTLSAELLAPEPEQLPLS